MKTETKSKILIIENSLIHREMLAMAFMEAEFEYEMAANGDQAMLLLKEGKFEFIMINIFLPLMDGFTFIHELGGLEWKKYPKILAIMDEGMYEDPELGKSRLLRLAKDLGLDLMIRQFGSTPEQLLLDLTRV